MYSWLHNHLHQCFLGMYDIYNIHMYNPEAQQAYLGKMLESQSSLGVCVVNIYSTHQFGEFCCFVIANYNRQKTSAAVKLQGGSCLIRASGLVDHPHYSMWHTPVASQMVSMWQGLKRLGHTHCEWLFQLDFFSGH